ncbi:NADH-quinone oxidoreductase subunit E [Rickettsiales endosymbiont of Paramecium tredecaurelia]|uniref:NADH-quinone oxidoreductase subunit NuoE family protein n=1 Tax=Candidatus Sarmatiella mevalonica TaxID=2770581 RepID=UPI001923A5B9|nr:NAD(P)H-dependent oxidoreductase subunit E [Candidatus Sarmatiella mevalonica]MBL3284313.1 NADH-quinone oxidoreductase subunit E [Candidatus Sarmatiella mevalonica]
MTHAFAFSSENLAKFHLILAKYPKDQKRSALLPCLMLVQNQNDGWLSVEAMEYVAQLLDLPYIRVYEVATFYSMFQLEPRGKFHFKVCTTTPCCLVKSDELLALIREQTCVSDAKNISEDGLFSVSEVECLGACVGAPVVHINNECHEKVTPQSMIDIIRSLKKSDAGRG